MSHFFDKKNSVNTQVGGIWSFIINPTTGRQVSVNGKLGQEIIKNYLDELDNQLYGGSDVEKSLHKQRLSDEVSEVEGCNIQIINDGSQGTVITAESLGFPANKLVKIFKPEPDSAVKWQNRVGIYQKLRKVDPEQTRFLIPEIINVDGDLKCLSQYFGKVQRTATMFNILVELRDPQILSKKAYRFLSKSIDLLTTIGVVHSDLPGNVMMDPVSNLPVIIDFDNSYVESTTNIRSGSFDRRAFLSHFRTVKRKTNSRINI